MAPGKAVPASGKPVEVQPDAQASAPDGPQPALEPSSRLCVKGLPKYLTEARLKEHFSAKGEVTDVKVVKTRDGQSRQMGFVGFKSTEEAAAALKYFNQTFIDATRISVEYARKYKDPSLARPWSKHSEGSSAHQKKVEAVAAAAAKEVDGSMAEAHALINKLKAKGEKAGAAAAAAGGKAGKGGLSGKLEAAAAEDPKLAEFLALMAPRSRAKLWGNDELAPVQTLEDLMGKAQGGSDDEAGPDDGGESDEEYQELGGEGGFGRLGARKGAKGSSGAAADDDDDEEDGDTGVASEEEEEEEEGGAKVAPALKGKEAVVVSEAVSDLDYLKARMKKWDDNDDEEEEEEPAAQGPMEVDSEEDAAMRGDQTGVGPGPGSSKKKDGAAAAAAAGKHAKAKSGGPGSGQEEAGAGSGEGAEDEEEEEEGRGKGKEGQQGGPEPMVVEAADGEDPIATIRDTGRLFVRNLAYTAAEADLSELFGRYGDVAEVHVVLDRETKRSKGIAYVMYVMPEDAVRAYQELDGVIFQGRLLHILPSRKPPRSAALASGLADDGVEGGEGGEGGEEGANGRNAAGSSFKAEREARRKADAGNRAAWNSLFMRQDTVAEAVAAHYGVSKSELLDARTSADLPVRMALGEAAVIAQTKTALADAGVDVGALEAAAAAAGKASANKSVARSPTTLLVKNLPFSTDEDALSALFERVGPVARLVLPPSRGLALVEFCEPQDARSAFKALAYKKFQHVPLYLEWAPKEIFSTPAPERPAPKAKAAPAAAAAAAEAGAAGKAAAAAAAPAVPAKKGGQQKEGVAEEEEKKGVAKALLAKEGAEDEDGETAVGTIYVKNLSFATTDASFKKHFDKAVSAVGGTLHSARVARRKGPQGEALSAGFGFVEVDSPEVAAQVITKLQGSMLDNHKLSLQLSKRRAPGATPAAGAKGGAAAQQGGAAGSGAGLGKTGKTEGGATAKLVVRNVAFEATRKDIAGLFAPFGHLKSCRLPKKFDGSHRGFAFVEYVTKQEARNAMEGVSGTHLYGRRLVVEYAKEDEGLDELRAKTGSKFREEGAGLAGAEPAAKRLRKGL